jgi:hypothetical protein
MLSAICGCLLLLVFCQREPKRRPLLRGDRVVVLFKR